MRRPIPSDPCKRNCFPDPGTPSLTQGEADFFPLSCQINSHLALPGTSFVVPLQASTFPLVSPRQVKSFNPSDLSENNAQAHQTPNKNSTHRNNCFQINSRDEKQKNEGIVVYNSLEEIKTLQDLQAPYCDTLLYLDILIVHIRSTVSYPEATQLFQSS